MKNKEWLITGGTGSLGQELTKQIFGNYAPKGVRIFSRDELKQWKMKQTFQDKPIAFILGDIRDAKGLSIASKKVDVIIHAAALKQVPSCELNPLEAIKTNIIGSQNVLLAALQNKISKVMFISTDKAVSPINLYGATKMCAEKIFINGNVYSGGRHPYFSCCRYGNVLGSRGSIVPLFKKQMKTGTITITDPKMTRFWIILKHAVNFILKCIDDMKGNEIFVPFMGNSMVKQIADVIAPGTKREYIGIRDGEKMHETLINIEEGYRTLIDNDKNRFVITTTKQHNDRIEYNSRKSTDTLTNEQIRKMINFV